MNQTQPLSPAIVAPGQGPTLHAFGEEIQLLLTGEHTGGQSTLFLEVTPPAGGPPPHLHDNEDEWFHVLEGCVSFFHDDHWTEVGPGGTAFMPRGLPHTFKNTGETPSTMLIQTSPSGFETFLQRSADEFARPEGPDPERLMAISAEHGIHFLES